MKKINLTLIFLTALFSAIYIGCGEDTNTGPGTSTYPVIDMKQGYVYSFTNDTIPRNGPETSYRTRIITKDSIMGKVTFQGYSDVWKVPSISRDTGIAYPPGFVVKRDTLYLRYDTAAGKFYQWDLVKYIDTAGTQHTPSWNVVADFSVSQGTTYSITSFTYFGIPVTVTGKVASDTVIQTTANPSSTWKCYRVEIAASPSGFPTIYIDYFLGYTPSSAPANPSGPIELRLHRYSAFGNSYPGFDSRLQTIKTYP